ncbi:hypothetical protein ACHAWF_007635 [Thalassiosira exigua]
MAMESLGTAAAASGPSCSFGRDLLIFASASVLTCLAIAGYNLYIDRKAEDLAKKDKRDGDDAEGGRRPRPGLRAPRQEASGSIAAALAASEGGVYSSGRFLTAVLGQMWDHANPAVTKAVREALEPLLADLKAVSLRFVKLDLGGVPIQARNMFIHRRGGDGGRQFVQIDFDVEWDGECDIMLEADVATKTISFGVRHFKLSGRMSVLLGPLVDALPVISAAQFGFVNPPELTNSLSLPFVDAKAKLVEVVQGAVAGVLCLPQRMPIPIDPATYDYREAYLPPAGMMRLAVRSGRGFRASRGPLVKDVPDVYCRLSLGASGCMGVGKKHRTSTCRNALSPAWAYGECCDLILYAPDQIVYVDAYDEDRGPNPDDFLGSAEVSARDLLGNDGTTELELTVEGEKTGRYVTVTGELFQLSERLDSLSMPRFSKDGQVCGLMTILVTRAFDIPLPKEDAATLVKVIYGDGADHKKEFLTPAVMDGPGIDSLNPSYDSAFHVPLSATMLARTGKNDVSFALIDGEGANKSKGRGELGRFRITHENLRGAAGHVVKETRAIGEGGARLEVCVTLSGMRAERGSVTAPSAPVSAGEVLTTSSAPALAPQAAEDTPLLASVPTPSPGGEGSEPSDLATIRVTAVSGRGFKVLKHRVRKDDVPDVYCKIKLISPSHPSSSSFWETPTVKNTTEPHWNDSKNFNEIHPEGSSLVVEAWDANKYTKKDELLGTTAFSVEKLLREGTMEMELRDGKSGSFGTFVTLKCARLG